MIGRTNAGNGGDLSLKVVGGTAIPAYPKENMVWVYTDAKITKYVLRDSLPAVPAGGTVADSEDGTVWVMLTHSAKTVTIGRKSKMVAGIGTVYLWKDGKRTVVPAFLYTGSSWARISAGPVYLYKNGNKCEGITGAWGAYSPSQLSTSTILLASTVVTRNKIPRALGSTLTVKMNITANTGHVTTGVSSSIANAEDGYMVSDVKASGTTGEITVQLSTGRLTADGYIKLFATNARAVVSEIYVS